MFLLIRLAILLFLLPSSGIAAEMNSEVIPQNLFPGDVFLIEVESMKRPSGKFHGQTIEFYQVAGGLYQAISSIGTDTKPGSYTMVVSTVDTSRRHILLVQKKKFPVQRLTLPEEKVFLSPENLARVKKESQKLSEIWGKVSVPLWEGRFIPPLNTQVSTVFGVVRIINGKRESIHRGTDYRGKKGKPIKAINSGTVVLTDDLFFGGKTVMINHGAGVYSIYMHLSAFKVKDAQGVKKGEVIGLVGSSGRATGPHLHLGIKVHGASVNPESLYSLPLSEG